jgi:predicted deacylase
MLIINKIILIILSIILIISIFYFSKRLEFFSNKNICPPLEIKEITTNNKKSKYNKILILGGVHGNEYGPSYGIEEFYNKNKNKMNGNITFIPNVNSEGIKKNTRYLPCKSETNLNYDINRNFTIDNVNDFQKQLIKIVNNHDIILDFHEGYDFHKTNSNSIGSTIIPGNNYSNKKIFFDVEKISNKLLEAINKTIEKEERKFTVLTTDKFDIKNTLRDYCEIKNKPYILIEITGQNSNLQSLESRKNQSKIILEQFLKEVGCL